MVNYQHGKIYKLVNSVTDDFYIGSTAEPRLSRRLSGHRGMAKAGLKTRIYDKMREIGIKVFRIVLIEDYPCENKEKLIAREDYFIQLLKPNMNKNRASTTEKEKKQQMEDWRDQNKDYFKDYYDQNKDYFKDYFKDWRDQNKDYFKEYYEQNKEHYKNYSKEIYKTIPKTILCCEKLHTLYSIKQHESSQKHKLLSPNIIFSDE